MSIEQNDVSRILKYLDDGSTIHKMVHLRPSEGANHRELLAITSSALVRYTRDGDQETINLAFLSHITGMRFTQNTLNIAGAVGGGIMLLIGFFLFFLGFIGLIIGVLLIIGGIVLLATSLQAEGSFRIISYDAESPIVDAHFSRAQAGGVIGILTSLQRVLALRSAGEKEIPPPNVITAESEQKTITIQKPDPAAGPATQTVVLAPASAPTEGIPAILPPGKKRCPSCGSIIPETQDFCEECGAPQKNK